jgi:hypothetical protein
VSETQLPPSAPPDVSPARLHGEACWWCGAVNTNLHPAGEVTTAVDDGHRVWQVMACGTHQGRAVAGGPPAMVSTPVATTTGRPAYVVHAAGAEVPATAPGCGPGCWCGGRP